MTKANEFDRINELLIERTAENKTFSGSSKELQKNKLKKFLTKANEFDKINELLIERTAKKLKKTSKNKSKKVLDKRKALW